MVGPVHAHRPDEELSSAASGRHLPASVTVVGTAEMLTRLSLDL